MKKLVYILVLFCFCQTADAQPRVDSTGMPVYTSLHADSRLDIVLKKRKVSSGGSSIYSGPGYRVQIYSGSDRAKANKMKIDFVRRFPGVRAYITYVSPHFRVKVGDFGSRAEALELYRQLSSMYNPCMIVPDIVVFRNFSSNKSKDDKSDTD